MRGTLPNLPLPVRSLALVGLGAFVLLATEGASARAASQGDLAATHSYLEANLAFVRAASAKVPAMERVLHAIPARIGGECPAAAKGSPQNPQSTQLSNELIGEIVLSGGRLLRGAANSYLRAVSSLRWSDPALDRAVRTYASKVRRMETLPLPQVCQDVSAWAASGYTTLSPATVSFSATFMSVWVAPGILPAALSASESTAEQPLIHRTIELEDAFTEWETIEETTWWDAMDALDLWP